MPLENNSINDFWVIGLNYRNSDTALRGAYAVQDEQYAGILDAAADYGLSELFVLSTCNRTEIYGFATDAGLLIKLLCRFTVGAEADFIAHAYRKQGKEAVGHIFDVAAGLDSQILGDYEIVGQLKKAIYFSAERGHVGIFTDRLFKNVLQSCRAIRSKTRLSSGTVSVAHAAVLFLKQKLPTFKNKDILVIGLGKIGENACKNLLAFIPGRQIALMNRTEEKAKRLANCLKGSVVLPFEKKEEAIRHAEVIIVATNAAQPILTGADFDGVGEKILLDLSIPNNIDPAVRDNPNLTLVDVDELSRINDATLQRRAKEVPQAKTFITYYIHQFAEWYLMRRNVPVLKAVKEKLSELNHNLDVAKDENDEVRMQKVINHMAAKIKSEGMSSGCRYIEALNGYLAEVSPDAK